MSGYESNRKALKNLFQTQINAAPCQTYPCVPSLLLHTPRAQRVADVGAAGRDAPNPVHR